MLSSCCTSDWLSHSTYPAHTLTPISTPPPSPLRSSILLLHHSPLPPRCTNKLIAPGVPILITGWLCVHLQYVFSAGSGCFNAGFCFQTSHLPRMSWRCHSKQWLRILSSAMITSPIFFSTMVLIRWQLFFLVPCHLLIHPLSACLFVSLFVWSLCGVCVCAHFFTPANGK